MSGKTRIPNFEALPIAKEIGRLVKPACEQIAIAGSLRRKKVDIGDIELVAIPHIFPEGNALHWLTDKLLEEGIIQPAEKKAWGEKQRKFVFEGIQIDLYLANWQNWGYVYWLRTGPSDANQYIMRQFFKKKSPYERNDGFVWCDGEKLWLDTEEKWFRLLGMPYLPPQERTTERYKQLIGDSKHRWGDPKPYLVQPFHLRKPEPKPQPQQVAKQKTLFDAMQPTKHIRITPLEQPAPAAETVWQFDPLFIVDNMVWTLCKGRWSLEPSNSNAVKDFITRIQANPSMLDGLIVNLRQHLAYEPNWNGREFTFDYEMEGDFHESVLHTWHAKPKVEDVPIESLLPGAQDTALKKHVSKYFHRYRTMGREGFRNDRDEFPVALKFNDDEHYYITDGHHRYMTALLLDLPYLPCQVDYIDKSIHDCIWWWSEEVEETA